MGNHTSGRQIVERAITVLLSMPDTPPLEILDRAVSGYQNTDAVFDSVDPGNPDHAHPLYEDERYLPSPFGEILRRAFAPDLDPREMLFATGKDSDDPEVQARIEAALAIWDTRVIRPFANRYGLW